MVGNIQVPQQGIAAGEEPESDRGESGSARPQLSLFEIVGRDKLKSAALFAGLDKHQASHSKNPIPKYNYSLVIADVNYGCKKPSARDDKRWYHRDFVAGFKNVKDANEAEEYVVIVFLHDNQIHVSSHS
jgi:hypothetical protein